MNWSQFGVIFYFCLDLQQVFIDIALRTPLKVKGHLISRYTPLVSTRRCLATSEPWIQMPCSLLFNCPTRGWCQQPHYSIFPWYSNKNTINESLHMRFWLCRTDKDVLSLLYNLCRWSSVPLARAIFAWLTYNCHAQLGTGDTVDCPPPTQACMCERMLPLCVT